MKSFKLSTLQEQAGLLEAIENTDICTFWYYPQEKLITMNNRTAQIYQCQNIYTDMPMSFADDFVHTGELHSGAEHVPMQKEERENPVAADGDVLESGMSVCIQISGFYKQESKSASGKGRDADTPSLRRTGASNRYQFLYISDQFLSD